MERNGARHFDRATRERIIRQYIEAAMAIDRQIPTVRVVQKAVGGDTGFVAEILREYRDKALSSEYARTGFNVGRLR